jgi:cell division protein ZapA (FtsZ GTPase activity inhibitor)
MNENDFERIGQIIDSRLKRVDDRFEQMEALTVKQGEEFQRHLTVVADSFDHKIALLADGHRSLTEEVKEIRETVERLDAKVDKVELRLTDKLNKIAEDLAAHRSDTEAHHGIYVVKES